jgi:methionine-rich copper-binding protein CopC
MKRVIGIVLGLSLTATAYAHTKLSATAPPADQSVTAPRTIELAFEGEVRLTSLVLTDAAGAAKHLDAVPAAVGSKFALAVHEPLAPGAYKVVWRAVGGDTHIITGEFRFTVIAAPAR